MGTVYLIHLSQWGHGFVAVESGARQPGQLAMLVPSQWGHGFVAVERYGPSSVSIMMTGRNGATAL